MDEHKHYFRMDGDAHFGDSDFGIYGLRAVVYCRGCLKWFRVWLGTGTFERIVLSPGTSGTALRNFAACAHGHPQVDDAAIADECAEGGHDFKRVRVPGSVGASGTMYLCLKCLKVEFFPQERLRSLSMEI